MSSFLIALLSNCAAVLSQICIVGPCTIGARSIPGYRILECSEKREPCSCPIRRLKGKRPCKAPMNARPETPVCCGALQGAVRSLGTLRCDAKWCRGFCPPARCKDHLPYKPGQKMDRKHVTERLWAPCKAPKEIHAKIIQIF